MEKEYKPVELSFYRHKEYKQFYLRRTQLYGGSEDSAFYDVTTDPMEAIQSLSYHGEDFLSWLRAFPNNWVTASLYKKFSIDGYTGKMKKELKLRVADFELVTLAEKDRMEDNNAE